MSCATTLPAATRPPRTTPRTADRRASSDPHGRPIRTTTMRWPRPMGGPWPSTRPLRVVPYGWRTIPSPRTLCGHQPAIRRVIGSASTGPVAAPAQSNGGCPDSSCVLKTLPSTGPARSVVLLANRGRSSRRGSSAGSAAMFTHTHTVDASMPAVRADHWAAMAVRDTSCIPSARCCATTSAPTSLADRCQTETYHACMRGPW